jgi:hypothetical protein
MIDVRMRQKHCSDLSWIEPPLLAVEGIHVLAALKKTAVDQILLSIVQQET